MHLRFTLFLVNAILVASLPAIPKTHAKAGDCGYESCPVLNWNNINVHIVPHSHDDVGWLKTVDQYYYGTEIHHQRANVESIIESVVRELQKNPERKFIQVESAFFWKWWISNPDKHDVVQELVDNGQLEFIGGAWSMNDEANSHYQSTIDQFTLGLRFLNDTFGTCGHPKIGWQIDPFGHTREQASLFSQIGYDAIYFARLDWRDRTKRLETKTPEMVWQGSPSLGAASNIFTSVLYNFYMHPNGFCFDILCSDEYIVDDQESEAYNVDSKVNKFIEFVNEQAQYYRTSNIILTFGGDFTYQDAAVNYNNIDKLIKYTNQMQEDQGGNIKLMYSTPSCYVKAVNDEAMEKGTTLPLKTDDFLPYASDPHAYWTGYFTSRPTQKRFERQGNNLLQVAKHIYGFAKAIKSVELGDLLPLQQAMGIMQHHDAITGTEKQHVADDYARIVKDAFDKVQVDFGAALKALLGKSDTAPVLPFATCILANVSICDTSNEDAFIVAVYNPLSRPISHYIRLPVSGNAYTISGPNNEQIVSQITPSIDVFDYIPMTNAPYDLVFLAVDLPPLGLKLYYVEKVTDGDIMPPDSSPDRYQLGTNTFGLIIDETTGLLKEVRNGDVFIPVTQQFYWYEGAVGNNDGFENRASGAYIFRPSADNPDAIPIESTVEVTVYKGDLLDEAHQIINPWIKQIIRVYKQESYIEFDWLVGPIPITAEDNTAKEIVSKFTTNLQTAERFYTDSNGREMMQRIRNYRPTYNYTNEEPVAGNYYPITSRIVLKDVANNVQFSILTDRAQGGSSLNDGEVELMVHRRLLADDAFGVGEVLDEQEYDQPLVVRGQHYMVFGKIDNAPEKTMDAQNRDLAQRKILSPWTLLSSTNGLDLSGLATAYNLDFSGLTQGLPDNVQILTFEPISDGRYILRLEHVLETGEDPTLSQPVEIDIESIFSFSTVASMQETTLASNKWIEDNARLQWNIEEKLNYYKFKLENTEKYNFVSHATQKKHEVKRSSETKQNKALNITLNPMQIRTFIITFA